MSAMKSMFVAAQDGEAEFSLDALIDEQNSAHAVKVHCITLHGRDGREYEIMPHGCYIDFGRLETNGLVEARDIDALVAELRDVRSVMRRLRKPGDLL